MIEKVKEYCHYGQERVDETEYEDNAISNAAFDIKPQKVTMEEMIAKGYFTVGEWFYFKKGDAVAQLMKDGKLQYNGEILDMHSCAAIARGVKAERLNGFDYWWVMRNNERVSIADVREQFRAKNAPLPLSSATHC